jgi:hypothetical protein
MLLAITDWPGKLAAEIDKRIKTIGRSRSFGLCVSRIGKDVIMRELGDGSGHSVTPGAMAAPVQPLTVEHTLAGRISEGDRLSSFRAYSRSVAAGYYRIGSAGCAVAPC